MTKNWIPIESGGGLNGFEEEESVCSLVFVIGIGNYDNILKYNGTMEIQLSKAK